MILANDRKASQAIRLDEKSNVELPFLAELEKLGWAVLCLEQVQTPEQSGRTRFDQVILLRTTTHARGSSSSSWEAPH
jgi:hypothetical protein